MTGARHLQKKCTYMYIPNDFIKISVQTALVDGGYTEVLETSCGSSVIAIGSTIYELSGIDLENRDLEVLTMSSDSCTTANTPSSADCYR